MGKVLFGTSHFFKAEGELPVPQGFPEVEQILSYHGYLSEVKGDIQGSRLFLTGKIETHLVYRGKEVQDRVSEHGVVWRGEEGAVFNEEINLPELKADWDWELCLVNLILQPEAAEVVKYHLEIEVKIWARKSSMVRFIKEIESEKKIQPVTEQLISEELVLTTYLNREVNNHFPLTYPKPPLARILDCQVIPVDSSATLSKGRVSIEGKLEVYLVYVTLTDEGKEGGIEAQRWTEDNGGAIPFQIIQDNPQLSNEFSANHEIRIEGVQMQSSTPESCRLQVIINVRVDVVRPKPVKVVLDLTSEQEEILDIQRGAGEIEEIIGETEKTIMVEKTLLLPSELKNIGRLLQAKMSGPKLQLQTELEQVLITGEAQLGIVYQSQGIDGEESTVEASFWGRGETEAVSFAEFLEMPGVEDGMQARIYLNANRLRVEQLDERSIKFTLELKTRVKVWQSRTLALVKDVVLVIPQDIPKPSMLFYLVQPGDTLWKIARRYNTTMDSIISENRLIDPEKEIITGKKLLIPKKLIAKRSVTS
jgi:LysM repeat protein